MPNLIKEPRKIDWEDVITRDEFEMACDHHFKATLKTVRDVMKEAKLEPSVFGGEQGMIVLVGGSSRVPKIQEMLSELCGGKLNHRVNPDEAVAFGATVLAAKLAGQDIGTEINLVDVLPQSIGVETGFGDFHPMLVKNSMIP